MAMG
jgi:uncharacterized protein (UPF0335 family)